MRRVVLLAVVLGALAGCGGAATGAATRTAATSSSSTPTTPADPYTIYSQTVTKLGLTPEVQRSEAVSVAGNTCDNTVTDMRGLIQGLRTLYPSPQQMAGFVTDRAVLIDTYCPSARTVFDAATQAELGYAAPVH